MLKSQPNKVYFRKRNTRNGISLYNRKTRMAKKKYPLKNLLNIKKKLDDLQFQFQKAEQEGDLTLAAQVKHGQIPNIQAKIKSLDVSWKLNKDIV